MTTRLPTLGRTQFDMAVTVDDLPAFGSLPPGASRAGVVRQMLQSMRAQGITGSVGFVNGVAVQSDPTNLEVLRAWVDAGHALGNHTWSHVALSRVGAERFLADAERNEALLGVLQTDAVPRWFRHPELDDGDTAADRDRANAWLAAQGYRVVPVTMAVQDYQFHEPFVRCVEHGDNDGMGWARDAFLANARRRIERTLAFTHATFGRQPPHVLLVHPSAFMAVVLPDLLALCAELGGRFVPVAEAMADDFYATGAAPGDVSFVDIRMGGRGNTLKSLNDMPLERLSAIGAPTM